jgi:Cys-tRNA(Pro)/Cys-tRNA(Cys) deacylase
VKTNASRALDRLGIAYELREYEGDPTTLDAGALSAAIGMPAEQIYKTLVVTGSSVSIAVVSIAEALDLKALAKVTGDKKIELAPIAKLFALTGYVRGGVTALATKKPLEVFLDEKALTFETIGVSAGTKGAELILAPADYVRATNAQVGPIARAEPH